MEVENHPKWKDTNIGDTPIFHFHDDWRKGNPTLKIERCPNDTKDYCKSDDDSILVGGFSHPFEKYAQVKFHHFPRDRDENKYCLKPRRNEICINFFYLSIFTVMKGKGNLCLYAPRTITPCHTGLLLTESSSACHLMARQMASNPSRVTGRTQGNPCIRATQIPLGRGSTCISKSCVSYSTSSRIQVTRANVVV